MTLRAIVGAVTGLAILLFSTCYAGGENWTFTVTAFNSHHSDKYVIELSPVERGDTFPSSCGTLTIAGEYASLFWLSKSRGGPSRKDHKAALALLEEAFKSRRPIKLGWIGDGVNVTRKAGACTATSRGLMIDAASDAIYSYFKWP
jgi:hypothetical protein